MEAPVRPNGIPEAAESIADWTEWGEGRTADGLREGPWRFWREDGTFCEESELRAGKLHGEKRRYHDDGSLASRQVWEDGVQRSMRVFRTTAPTREENLPALPEVIRELAFGYPEAGWIDLQRFFTADGTEVDFTGVPTPPHPENVPENAYFASQHGTWVCGEWQAGTAKNRGVRRYWEPGGRMIRVEYYRDGSCVSVFDRRNLYERGNPLIDAFRDGDQRSVGILLGHGLGRSPHAALHAAHEELPELARILTAQPPGDAELPDVRRPPVRDEAVDPAAVWVPGLSSWVLGAVDADGKAVGAWPRWWSPYDTSAGEVRRTPDDAEPIKTSFCSKYETDWVDGRRRVLRDFHLRGPRLAKVFEYDAQGVERVRRDYTDDGVLDRERETTPDGTTVDRRFHPDGQKKSERTVAEDAVEERWWGADGVLTGVVGPHTGPPVLDDDGDEVAVEWYRAVDPAGVAYAEGPVGKRGGAVGGWTVDGKPMSWAGLEVRRSETLGEMARSVLAWRALPRPAALAGVDEVPWTELEPFFGDARSFPLLLIGLAVPDRRVFRHALYAMWDPVLHQGTVSGVGGPAIRYAVALYPEVRDPEDRGLLLDFLVSVATRQGQLGAAHRLKQIRQARPADANPGTFFGESDTEPAYAEILEAITAAEPQWEAALSTDDAKTRRYAAVLLGVADDPRAAARLQRLAAEDPDPTIRAEALLALTLHAGAPGLAETLDAGCADADASIRFCAALSRLRTKTIPLDRAVDVVVAVLGGEETPLHRQLYLSAARPVTDAVNALSLLPTEDVTALVPRLAQCIDEVDAIGAVSVTAALLDVVFPRRAWDGEAPLTEPQRTAVRAIATSEQAWRFNVNLFEVLRNNGLPTERAALRSLADG